MVSLSRYEARAMSRNTMRDTYVGHKNAADFVAEDGRECVEIWQHRVGILDEAHSRHILVDR